MKTNDAACAPLPVIWQQLCARFSLSDAELRTVLEALSYVFEQVKLSAVAMRYLPERIVLIE